MSTAKHYGSKTLPEFLEEFPENVRPMLKWVFEFIRHRELKIEAIEEEIPIYDLFGDEICKAHLDVRFSTPEGLPHIVDWKTGMKRTYDLQLKAYALGVMDKLGCNYCLTGVAYPETGEYYESPVEYREASQAVYALSDQFKVKTSRHHINGYCSWCLHNHKCPAWTKEADRALAVTGSLSRYTAADIDTLKNDPGRLDEFLLLYERLKDMLEKEWKLKEALMTHTDLGYQPVNFIKISVDAKTEEVQSVDSLPFLRRMYKKLGIDKVATMITVDAVKAQEAWKEIEPEEKFPLLVKYDVTEKKGYSYLRRKIK